MWTTKGRPPKRIIGIPAARAELLKILKNTPKDVNKLRNVYISDADIHTDQVYTVKIKGGEE